MHEPAEIDPPEGAKAPLAACQTEAPDRLLTRKPAAEAIGVSVSTFIRRFEKTLTTVPGSSTTHHFYESEILALAVRVRAERAAPESTEPSDAGKLAARVFTLLDDGANPADVVKRLELAPSVVDPLHAAWARMRGTLVLSGDEAAAINALDWTGPPLPHAVRSGAALVDRIRDLHVVFQHEMRPCDRCDAGKRAVCERCFRHEEIVLKDRARQNTEIARTERLVIARQGKKKAPKE